MAAWIETVPNLPHLLMGAVVLLIILWGADMARARRRVQAMEEARSAALERVMAAETARSTAEAARQESHVRAERLEETVAGLRDQIGALRQERGAVQAALEATRGQAEALRTDLRVQATAAEKDRDAADQAIEQLRELREEMTQRFREMADESLRRQGEDAAKVQQERLSALLTPLREHVGRFEEELRAVHRSADQERARLGEQIAQLHRRSEEISVEAVNLTRALKGEKQRQGAWGEMILERILEESGLEHGIHYHIQSSRRDEEGRALRPDVVVRMPRGKSVVVDSKVSLVAFEAAVNAETPEARAQRMREHVLALRSHIDRLGDKGYAATEEGVDYVLMFVPIEGALSEALREQPDLTGYALSKGIGLMTPTTLMVALRTIEHVWMVERRERNAEEIARRAGLLYEKVAGFVESMNMVGTHLTRAVAAQEEAMNRLSRGSGNVLGQVEKLKRLGASTTKTLPAPFDEEDDRPPALERPSVEAAE